MFSKKTKIPADEYLDQQKIPEDWFIPISEFGSSDVIKNYMEEDARKKVLKVTLEALVKERRKK